MRASFAGKTLGSGRRGLVAATAALLAGAVLAPVASAEVEVGRNLEINHSIQLGLLEGWEPGQQVRVDVFRGTTLIATKSGTVEADAKVGGIFEINHVGGTDCWEGVTAGTTPDVQPGDKMVATVIDPVTGLDTADVDYVFVRDVEFDENPDGTITGHLRGVETAPGVFNINAAVPVATEIVEAKRVLAPTPSDYLFLDGDTDANGEFVDLDIGGTPNAGELFIDHLSEDGGGTGTTVAFRSSEAPDIPCGPIVTSALTDNDHPSINIANVGIDMVVGGPILDTVDVTALTFANVPYAVTEGAGVWSATIPAADLGALAEGTHTLAATFSDGSSDDMQVVKDVTAPDLSADPPSGAYVGNQGVALASNGGEDVRFTLDGSVPGGTSRLYDGTPVALGPGTHTIRAFSMDPAGNRTDETFDYVISSPPGGGAGGGAGVGGGAGAGGGPVVLPDPLASFRIRSLRAPGRISLRRARRSGVTVRFIAPEGTQAVQASLYRNTNASSHRTRRLVKRLTRSADGGRLSVRFADRRTRRKFRRGVYTISVAPSSDGTTFAEGTAKRFRVR